MREKIGYFECLKCGQIQLKENDMSGPSSVGKLACLGDGMDTESVNVRVSRGGLGAKGAAQLCNSVRLKEMGQESLLSKFVEVHLEVQKSEILSFLAM